MSAQVEAKAAPAGYAEIRGHFSTAKFGKSAFGRAADAMRLIGMPWAEFGLATGVPADRDGSGVNIVVVDEGINRAYARGIGAVDDPAIEAFEAALYQPKGRRAPGTYRDPFSAPASWHTSMIVRNILRMAPRARIYDAPLLPGRVKDVMAFESDVAALFDSIISARNASPYKDQPWIICNAWAVSDPVQQYRKTDANARYCDGIDNPATAMIQAMSSEFDIVFAAGNAGEFSPVGGAGMYYTGPERCLNGANALGGVLTVGAVDVTGRWVGTSSQGDGPDVLKFGDEARKPDLAAPSWFRENADAYASNTGTSAACALVAGTIGALRSGAFEGSSKQLFQLLRDTAARPAGTGWNNRTGWGCLQWPEG